MLRNSLAIVTLAALVETGVAALPAQARTITDASASRVGQHQVARSGPSGIQVPPSQVAVQQAAALALARQRWLHGGRRTEQTAAATLAAAGVAHSGAAQRRMSALTGVVHGLSGRPVAGVCITATGPSGIVVARSRTDGQYLLAALSPGKYTLRASGCAATGSPTRAIWPGLPAQVTLGSAQVKAMPPVTVLAAAKRVSLAASAAVSASTGSIAGLVTGGGKPLRGICAEANRVGGGSGRSAITSLTGRYRITGLAPGRYQVQFTTLFGCGNAGNWLDQWYPYLTSPFPPANAADIQVTAGKTKFGVDAHMKLGGEIAGTVRTRSGQPLPGICLDIEGRIPGGFIGYGFGSMSGGRYVQHGLFPGRYTVGFSIGCGNPGNYVPQWWRMKTSAAHATPIEIQGTQIAMHIDAALDPGAAISGTIKAVNAAGKPLAGVCVEASSASALSGKDGTYKLKGLRAGTYVVDFDPSCFGLVPTNYLGQSRRVAVKTAQSVTGVNAYLKRGAGISGSVTDAHGRPLQGVCVQIAGARHDAFGQSGTDGSYSITGLPAGTYLVQFAGGCGNPGSVAPQYYNDEAGYGSADPITLAAGTITHGIDATMQPGATIAGVTTDAAGHRLSNICVGIADQSQVGFVGFDDIEFTSNGTYRAVNLAPGLYQVDFGCGAGGRFADQWFHTKAGAVPSTLISIPVGVTRGVSAVLHAGGAITGIVTNRGGRRLSNACLYAVDAKTGAQVLSTVFQGFTQGGRYELTGLAPGTYKVFFYGCGTKYASQWYHGRLTERAGDPVQVHARTTTAGIGAVLSVGGSISGQVFARATGKPVRNICVDAFDSASQAFGFAETNKAGTYTMRGLATGRYSISFSPCYAKGPNLAGLTRSSIEVTEPHAVSGINAWLPPGGTVSGRVTGGSHTQIGTCVLLIPVNPASPLGFAATGNDGTYSATDLPAGRYQVYFNDPTCSFFGGPQFASQWYKDQPTQATARTIAVSAGGTSTGISAKLQPFGQITGTVTGRAHAPVAGECVTAIPVGKDFAGFFQPAIAITRKTGSYSLLDLQPGEYKVEFSTGCGDSGLKTQWWRRARSAARATAINVTAGKIVTSVDAKLKE